MKRAYNRYKRVKISVDTLLIREEIVGIKAKDKVNRNQNFVTREDESGLLFIVDRGSWIVDRGMYETKPGMKTFTGMHDGSRTRIESYNGEKRPELSKGQTGIEKEERDGWSFKPAEWPRERVSLV